MAAGSVATTGGGELFAPVSLVVPVKSFTEAMTIEESRRSGADVEAVEPVALNEKALQVIQRVRQKLTGKDFVTATGDPLNVNDQVERLIDQATSYENLTQCYIGWCPFW